MKLQKSRKNPDKNSIEIHLIQQQIDECRNKLETCEKTIKEQKIHLLRFKKNIPLRHQIELLTDQISVLKETAQRKTKQKSKCVQKCDTEPKETHSKIDAA